MSLQTYQNMKPSGAYWLGDIPTHWEIASLKWKSEIYSGGTPDKNNSEYWHNGNIPWLNSGTVNQFIITKPTEFITAKGLHGSSAKWIDAGSIVMALAGQGKTKGMAALVTFRTTCNQSLAIIKPSNDILPKFLLYYLVKNYLPIRGLAGDGQRDGLNLAMLGTIPIPLLPKAEQRAIVAFLDEETGRIDALIAKKRALIARLQEKRTALISHAVTKGIDPTAPLKPSGISWLGDIPAHWDVVRLKFLSNIRYGLGQPPEQLENGLPLIRATNVERGKINPKDMLYIDPSDVPASRNAELSEGEIIVVRSGAYTGDSAIIPKQYAGAITGYDMVVNVTQAKSSFIAYSLLSSPILIGQIFPLRLRAAQPHLNKEELGDVLFCLPPQTEQSNIVQYLDDQCELMSNSINKVKNAIEKLTEYRTAVISAAVTGKIDVRSHQNKAQ